jgi:hypothetical protein
MTGLARVMHSTSPPQRPLARHHPRRYALDPPGASADWQPPRTPGGRWWTGEASHPGAAWRTGAPPVARTRRGRVPGPRGRGPIWRRRAARGARSALAVLRAARAKSVLRGPPGVRKRPLHRHFPISHADWRDDSAPCFVDRSRSILRTIVATIPKAIRSMTTTKRMVAAYNPISPTANPTPREGRATPR